MWASVAPVLGVAASLGCEDAQTFSSPSADPPVGAASSAPALPAGASSAAPQNVTTPSASAATPRPALGPGAVRLGTNARPELRAAAVDADEIVIDGDGADGAWSRAEPTTFDTDYSGRATGTFTRVRFAWSSSALHALFELDGAGLATDTTRPTSVERDRLYEEDCVEIFLTPEPSEKNRYFEIEVGPFGHLFDLDVQKGGRSDAGWSSAALVGTTRDPSARRATIEVALRSPEIVRALAPSARLPLGIYRMEGKGRRQFLAWSPPRTKKPSFHEPDAFGTLVLER